MAFADPTPRQGDTEEVLLRKLLQIIQGQSDEGGGGYITQAQGDARYFKLDGSNSPFTNTSATVVTVPDAFSLTSVGSISLTAGGSNKSITLTPSGSGVLTSAGVTQLTNATAATTVTSGALQVTGGISTQNEVYAYQLNAANPGATPTVVRSTSINGQDSRIQLSQTGQRTWYWYIPASSTELRLRDSSGSADIISWASGSGRMTFTPQAASIPAWGTSGSLTRWGGAIITDSNSPTGTVASAVFNSFAVPTINATNVSVVYTKLANVYIAGDVATTGNASATNSYSLDVVGKTLQEGALHFPSTNVIGAQWYNTVDQVTNLERLDISFASNQATIQTTAANAGTFRDLIIRSNGRSSLTFKGGVVGNTGGMVQFTNTATGVAGSIGWIFASTNTATSGTNIGVSQTPTYNQASGTAANTDISSFRTQTLVGSGLQKLLDLGVASTSWYTFAVGNAATTGAFNAASGTEIGATFSPNFSGQTSTAGYVGLRVNATGGAGSGVARILDLQSGGTTVCTIGSAGTPTFFANTATPANVNANTRIVMGSAGVSIYIGTGAPSTAAAKGSLYVRTDATTTITRLYINTDGSTSWTNFTSLA